MYDRVWNIQLFLMFNHTVCYIYHYGLDSNFACVIFDWSKSSCWIGNGKILQSALCWFWWLNTHLAEDHEAPWTMVWETTPMISHDIWWDVVGLSDARKTGSIAVFFSLCQSPFGHITVLDCCKVVPQFVNAKLVYKSNFTMVYRWYIELVNGD